MPDTDLPGTDPSRLSEEEIFSFLDEMLPVERSAEIEKLLRDRADLRQRVALLARRRDQGGHSVGEIWRRNRISCLTRQQLGNYLLGITEPALTDYISFHIDIIECRYCQANLSDLRSAFDSTDEDRRQRQRRHFESSAGRLHKQ